MGHYSCSCTVVEKLGANNSVVKGQEKSENV